VATLTKRCKICGETKPLSEFYKHKSTKDGVNCYCKKCDIETSRPRNRKSARKHCVKRAVNSRKWKKQNPKRCKANHLKNTYGITLEEYNAMLNSQKGVCAVCGKPESIKQLGKVRALCVDHDHKTEKVRGLLCTRCNAAMGMIGDSKELLFQLALYLEKHE
jgi:hypothetical protein